MGDEPYFIDKISDELERHVLSEEEKEFNFSMLYGKDSSMAQVITQARQVPLMAPYQLIIVKEAQNMRDFEVLSNYLSQPVETTILVICYKNGTLDQRKKTGKLAKSVGVLFNSKCLYDNELPSWIVNYCKSQNLRISVADAAIFAESTGTNLSALVNEIEKLKVILKKENTVQITGQIIEHYVGMSKEYNNFELQKAISIKDVMKSNRIINNFAKDPKNHPLVVTTTVLFNFFNTLMTYMWLIKVQKIQDKGQLASELKVNPYFLRDYDQASRYYTTSQILRAIHAIRTLDASSKGFGATGLTTQNELLKEAIFKIMH